MAENLATPSNTLVQVRWREPYVSRGLNKKLVGIAPSGVIRGGRLTTSLLASHVTVQADPDTNDSIYSFIDASGHQFTFRQEGDIVLDLDIGALPGTTVYIGLDVVYSVSAQTEVYWRGYSQVEVDADPTLVVLGSVAVPGAPALIPATDILYDRRRDAGLNLSTGMRDWRQVIKNPSFEGPADTIGAGDEREFFGWAFDVLFAAGTWRVLSPTSGPVSQPHSGDNSLVAVGGGGGAHLMSATPLGVHRVSPGQTVKVSMWVRGDSVALGSGASASVGFWIRAFQWDGSDVSDPSPWASGSLFIIENGTVINGSFGYFEISGEFKVPESASFIQPTIMVNDAASFSGTIEFDDVQVWLEPGPVHLPCDRNTDLISPEIMTHGLAVAPLLGQDGISKAVGGIWQRALRLICKVASSSDLEHEWGMVVPSIQDWLMSFPKGRISLGGDLVGSAFSALKARVTTPFPSDTVSEYMLLWFAENSSAEYQVRCYIAENSPLQQYPSVVVTHNAYWDGSLWHPDNAGRESIRRDIGYIGSSMYKRSAGAGNWADLDWDDGGANSNIIHSLVQNNIPGSLQGFQWMCNGILGFQDTVAGASSLYSNPNYDEIPIGNALYAKNIVKAWLFFGWSGTTPINYDGFNLELTSVGQYLTFTFGQNMQNDDYSIIVNGDEKSSGTIWNLLFPSNPATAKAVDAFDVTLVELNETGPTISEELFSGGSGTGSVIVIGRQDT